MHLDRVDGRGVRRPEREPGEREIKRRWDGVRDNGVLRGLVFLDFDLPTLCVYVCVCVCVYLHVCVCVCMCYIFH